MILQMRSHQVLSCAIMREKEYTVKWQTDLYPFGKLDHEEMPYIYMP